MGTSDIKELNLMQYTADLIFIDFYLGWMILQKHSKLILGLGHPHSYAT